MEAGCQDRAVHMRKIVPIKGVDYEIVKKVCSKHKNLFTRVSPVVNINFRDFAKQELLGTGNDENRNRFVKDNLEYMYEQAEKSDGGLSMQIMINAARYFAQKGDEKFLFGFYFSRLFFSYALKGFNTDANQRRRIEQIRNQMSLKRPYPEREHPDISDNIVDVCRCGHEEVRHELGTPRGECNKCLCPKYEFEQKMRWAEAFDLQTLIARELREKDASK